MKDPIIGSITYNKSQINSTMIKTMVNLKTCMSSEVRALFETINHEFGMEVLSGSYTKLRMLFLIVNKNPVALAWVLQSVLVGLRRQEMTVEELTCNSFTKTKGSPTPCFGVLAMTQQVMVNHLTQLCENVRMVDSTLAEALNKTVVQKLCTPLLFHETFPFAQVSGNITAAEDGDEELGCKGVAEDEETEAAFWSTLGEGAPRGAVLLATMFKKIYDGSYEDTVVKLANHQNAAKARSTMTRCWGCSGRT